MAGSIVLRGDASVRAYDEGGGEKSNLNDKEGGEDEDFGCGRFLAEGLRGVRCLRERVFFCCFLPAGIPRFFAVTERER
jgi:hypothetical protein